MKQTLKEAFDNFKKVQDQEKLNSKMIEKFVDFMK